MFYVVVLVVDQIVFAKITSADTNPLLKIVCPIVLRVICSKLVNQYGQPQPTHFHVCQPSGQYRSVRLHFADAFVVVNNIAIRIYVRINDRTCAYETTIPNRNFVTPACNNRSVITDNCDPSVVCADNEV